MLMLQKRSMTLAAWNPKDISKKVVEITQLLGDEGGASPLQHSKDHLDLIQTAWSMIWSAERNRARFTEWSHGRDAVVCHWKCPNGVYVWKCKSIYWSNVFLQQLVNLCEWPGMRHEYVRYTKQLYVQKIIQFGSTAKTSTWLCFGYCLCHVVCSQVLFAMETDLATLLPGHGIFSDHE